MKNKKILFAAVAMAALWVVSTESTAALVCYDTFVTPCPELKNVACPDVEGSIAVCSSTYSIYSNTTVTYSAFQLYNSTSTSYCFYRCNKQLPSGGLEFCGSKTITHQRYVPNYESSCTYTGGGGT